MDKLFAKFDETHDAPMEDEPIPPAPPSDDLHKELLDDVHEESNAFRDLLEVPVPELWEGLVYEGYLYFVDNVGFGWRVLLSTDEFFLRV